MEDTKEATTPATVEKFPELRAMMAKLQAERAVIAEFSAPHREAREALRVEMEPAEAKLRALNATIKEIEGPLFALDNQIGALAKAMGGRSMQAGSGE